MSRVQRGALLVQDLAAREQGLVTAKGFPSSSSVLVNRIGNRVELRDTSLLDVFIFLKYQYLNT